MLIVAPLTARLAHRFGDGATAPSSTALVVVGVAAGVIALATAGFAAAIRSAHTGGEAESAA